MGKFAWVFLLANAIVFSGVLALRSSAVSDSVGGSELQQTPGQDRATARAPRIEELTQNAADDETVVDEICGVCWVVPRKYINRTFGYRVEVPEGLRGLETAAGTSNHGFMMRLSDDTVSRIDVDGSFNSNFDPSPESIAEWSISEAEKQEGFALLWNRSVSLGSLHAVRYAVRYVDSKTKQVVVDEHLVALGGPTDTDGKPFMVYELALFAPEGKFPGYSKVFDAFVASWRPVKITD